MKESSGRTAATDPPVTPLHRPLGAIGRRSCARAAGAEPPEGAGLPESDLSETPPVDFERAIHAMHGTEADLIERVRVTEYFEGKRVAERDVLVFKLQDHPTASYCYAWEVGGDVTTVLGVGQVKNALDAVRASILASR